MVRIERYFRLLNHFLHLSTLFGVSLSLLLHERLVELLVLLVFDRTEHAGHQKGMVVHLTLPHGEHDVGRAPDQVIVEVWHDLDASDVVGYFLEGSDTASQVRLLLVPIVMLELVKKDVVGLHWKQDILVLRRDL